MLFPIKTHRCLGDTWGQKYKNLENQRKKEWKERLQLKRKWALAPHQALPSPSAGRRRWQWVRPSPERTTLPYPDMQCRAFIIKMDVSLDIAVPWKYIQQTHRNLCLVHGSAFPQRGLTSFTTPRDLQQHSLLINTLMIQQTMDRIMHTDNSLSIF